jgi:hypothetical protein
MKQVALRLAVVLAIFAWFSAGLTSAAEPKIDFNRQIRPILSDACFKCHGFDEGSRQAGLRLDSSAGATAKLESGAQAITPGKSAASELVRRVTSTDASEQMPPPGSGKTVSPAQIELLKKWIDQGAEYQLHWSFVAPVRPTVPAVKAGVVVNPIDSFILDRLSREGLTQAASADKVTLIRRVTLDLTGLPPTPQEIDAFLADSSAEAYEKVVDRLLRSPRFGEHLARYWLDAARYGDTHGLHFDNERSIWPYRDWVVSAFNRNLPFDQFTREQIAGDLLPGSTLEQKIASGFNRCNVSTSEGGSINDEVLARYAVDRTETMSTVFLGLTLGCAVCHDHKYDPVTQKEFYQLYAFFNTAADAAMDGNALAPPPIMKVAQTEQLSELQTLEKQVAELKQKMQQQIVAIDYVDPTPDASAPGKSLEPREFVWIDDVAPPGAKLQGDSPWKFVTAADGKVHSGEKATTRKATAVSQHFFTGASPGLAIGEGDKLFAYVYLNPENPPKTVMLQWNDGAWEHRAYWGEDAIPFGAGNGPHHYRAGDLPKAGEWVRLEVQAAQVGLKPGSSLNGWAFSQFGGEVFWDTAGSVTQTPQQGQGFESLAAWEAYEAKQKQSSAPKEVKDALKVAAEKRNDAHKKTLRDYFLLNVYSKTKEILAPLQKEVDAAEAKRKQVDAAIPTSLVMAEMPNPRETFVLIRGAYDKKGAKVTPGTPAILPPMPKDAPANRLGLAQWLTDPQHPLVARVTVNRFWQQYFGAGLVKTAEDFGSQGQWPTHPELLDWLARDFVDSGWDIKRLQKQIVMSAAYRQSSHVTPAILQKDPANELLARGPRFRLDAEAIRDSALNISGLLHEQQGGRGIRPYQPDGIWEAVAFQGSNTQNYKRDAGESLYRRSLYIFWKRTAPPPMLTTFDAPSREACVVRRARTNTPLQALLLMNDVQYVEAARSFAQRMLTEGGDSPEKRLAFAFRLATGRQPNEKEAGILARILASHLADFQADKTAAEKLVTIGETKRNEKLDISELAAYTMLGNLILNLDETVTKE